MLELAQACRYPYSSWLVRGPQWSDGCDAERIAAEGLAAIGHRLNARGVSRPAVLWSRRDVGITRSHATRRSARSRARSGAQTRSASSSKKVLSRRLPRELWNAAQALHGTTADPRRADAAPERVNAIAA